jgi:hypothetical protein
MTIYYLGRGDSDDAQPFPEGLQMLSGNNAARTLDNVTKTWSGERLLAERANFACVNYDKPGPETYGMVNTNCPQGLRAQIHMQSCWDGTRLTSPDQSHVAYLSRIDNGRCPPTHPILLPHLFYEVNYSMDNVDQSNGGQYMFANGDTTGYGFHGDFFNAWDTELLTRAIAQCLVNDQNPSGVVESCPAFDESNDVAAANRCTERGPVYPCEKVKGTLDVLPGCTLTNGAVRCSSANAPACAPEYNPVFLREAPGNDAFKSLGCYTEAATGRALTGKSSSGEDMSIGSCLDYCEGFAYAGVEYGQECYCGNTLASSAVSADSNTCDMPCKGDAFSFCGGSRRLNLYRAVASPSAPASTSTAVSSSTALVSPYSSSTATTVPHPTISGVPGSWSYRGCFTEASTGRALSGASTRSATLTPATCAQFCHDAGLPLAGLEYGSECYCGASLRPGALAAPESECKMACAGDGTVVCGAGDRLSVFEVAGYVAPNIPQVVSVAAAAGTTKTYAYHGCYTEASSGSALSSKTYADQKGMTVQACGDFCAAYDYFGVEYGGECYCGGGLGAGSTLVGDGECDMGCPGDWRQAACGSGQRLSVWRAGA